MDSCKIVEVLWIDSFFEHGWGDRAERLHHNRKPGQCRSVGYLIQDDDDWVVLAESVAANDNVGCTTTIPKIAIKSVVELIRG